jgi:hypothetical protein
MTDHTTSEDRRFLAQLGHPDCPSTYRARLLSLGDEVEASEQEHAKRGQRSHYAGTLDDLDETSPDSIEHARRRLRGHNEMMRQFTPAAGKESP